MLIIMIIMDVRNLAKNGLYYSIHAKEKMKLENISERDIKEVIENAEPKPDSSTTNYREHAWNRKQHHSLYYESLNLTVVCCESLEHGLFIVSVYHGKSHDIDSNPYQKRR